MFTHIFVFLLSLCMYMYLSSHVPVYVLFLYTCIFITTYVFCPSTLLVCVNALIFHVCMCLSVFLAAFAFGVPAEISLDGDEPCALFIYLFIADIFVHNSATFFLFAVVIILFFFFFFL
jgi:hypothetical protein